MTDAIDKLVDLAKSHALATGPFTARVFKKGDVQGDPEAFHYVHGGQCNVLANIVRFGAMPLDVAQTICERAKL